MQVIYSPSTHSSKNRREKWSWNRFGNDLKQGIKAGMKVPWEAKNR
jgi:hypothetical protein